MIRSFIEGIEIAGHGPLTAEHLAVAMTVRIKGADEREQRMADQLLKPVEDRIDRYVGAGGTAAGCDWNELSEIEQLMLMDAVTRHANRERSLLALQIAMGLGSPHAHKGLIPDDERLEATRTRAEVWEDALRSFRVYGGPQ